MNFKLKIRKNIDKIVLAISIFTLPLSSLAQGIVPAPCDTSGQICNPIEADNINGLIKQILEGVLTIAIPIIALAIIYCGFLFVQARGNPEEIKKAKTALMYTLVGSAILLGAWAIAQIISETVLAL